MPDVQICPFLFSLHMLLLHCPLSLWFRISVLLKGCWQSWCFWRVDSRKGHLHVVSDQSLISSLYKLPVFCVWIIHKLQTRSYYKLGQTVNSLWLKLQPKPSLNPVSCVSLQQLAVFCKVSANSLWLEAGNACPLLCLTWLFWIQSLWTSAVSMISQWSFFRNNFLLFGKQVSSYNCFFLLFFPLIVHASVTFKFPSVLVLHLLILSIGTIDVKGAILQQLLWFYIVFRKAM